MMMKLKRQASDRRRSLRELLDILSATVPDFVASVSAECRENRADRAQRKAPASSRRVHRFLSDQAGSAYPRLLKALRDGILTRVADRSVDKAFSSRGKMRRLCYGPIRAYSILAARSTGTSASAFFHSAKNSSYSALLAERSPTPARARAKPRCASATFGDNGSTVG